MTHPPQTDAQFVAEMAEQQWFEYKSDDVRRLVDIALVLLAAQPTCEEQVIENCVGHWFIQGGKAEFGMIADCRNPDELISAILRRVRDPEPDAAAPAPERPE